LIWFSLNLKLCDKNKKKRFNKFSQIQSRVNNYHFNGSMRTENTNILKQVVSHSNFDESVLVLDNKNHLEDRQFQNPNNGVLAKREDELEQEQTAIEINQQEKEVLPSEGKEAFENLAESVQDFSNKNCLTTKIENLENISLDRNDEKIQLREEIQSFLSQLVEGSLEISQKSTQ